MRNLGETWTPAHLQAIFAIVKQSCGRDDIHPRDGKVCSSFLNLLANRNTFHLLDLEVANPEIECACRHKTSMPNVHKYLRPQEQAPKKWNGMARLGNPGQPRGDTGNPTDNLPC
jgi:hypothetical protein